MKGRRLFMRFRTLAAFLLPLFGGLCICADSARAEREFHLSNEFSVTYNDVSGPGSNLSSLTEGFRYLDVLGATGNGTINSLEYNFNLGAKATDDSRNDIKNFSLTNMRARFTNRIHTLNLGDTFESFSQYTLNTAVKGFSYRYYDQERNLPDVTFLYGIAYSRWDNFYGVDAVERQVLGGRIKQNVTPDLWLAVSAVKTTDHMPVNNGPLTDNFNLTGDWEYRPITGLTLHGESSLSYSDNKDPSGFMAPDANGYAHKVEAIGDGGPSRASLEYELVSPDFQTTVGSATPDREKFKAKWRYKYSRNITTNLGFLWYRDNLDGQKSAGRTDRYKPEVGVTVKGLMDRQYSVSTLTYKLERSVATTTNTTDHLLNLNYRDRFGVLDSDSNLGIIRYDTTAARKAYEYTYNTSLNSRHSVGMFVIKPVVYLGGWTSRDELAASTDQIYEYSAGVGLDIPGLKITSNVKAGQNKLDKSNGGQDSSKTFANLNIYYRPPFLASLNEGVLFARAFVNDFAYNNAAVPQDFRENSITAGMNIQF